MKLIKVMRTTILILVISALNLVLWFGLKSKVNPNNESEAIIEIQN